MVDICKGHRSLGLFYRVRPIEYIYIYIWYLVPSISTACMVYSV